LLQQQKATTAKEVPDQPTAKKVTNADKIAEALKASKAQTCPKIQPEPSTKQNNNNNNSGSNGSSSSNSSNGGSSNNGKVGASAHRAPSQTPTKLIAEVKPMSKSGSGNGNDADRKCDSDEISEAEFSRQSVRKAAERFEKVASEESSARGPPPPLSSLGPRGRSKSIGHSLAQKLQEAEEDIPKPVLPWAASMNTEEPVRMVIFGN